MMADEIEARQCRLFFGLARLVTSLPEHLECVLQEKSPSQSVYEAR